MLKFEVRLRTITPTFMYGADGKTPEIRPQSIKGLLRFWYRALSGENELGKLHEEEGEIFGSTDEKKPSSSKVSVRVKNGLAINSNKISRTQGRDWQKVSKSQNQFSGTNYLYYSIKMGSKSDTGEKYFKDAILPGHEFTILLSSEDQTALEKAICSFWCLVYFDGIGSRSRRTAGSLEVLTTKNVDFKNEKLPSFILEEREAEDVVDFLFDNFEKMQDFVETKKTDKFSNLYGATIDVLNKPFRAWNEAVEKLGNDYKNFRATNKNEKIGFGLPVKGINSQIDRRSSPLILKVVKSKSNFFGLAVRLQGEFYPKSNISTNVVDNFTQSLDAEGGEF